MKTLTTKRSADLRSAPRATYRSSSTLLFLACALLVAGRADAGEAADVRSVSTARASASPSAAARGKAAAGDSYAVSRKSGDWVEVQFGASKAWLRRADVSLRQTALRRVTASSGLRVRSGAGANHRSLGALSRGVFVVDRGGSAVWRKISFEGKTGWVMARYLRAEEGVAETPGLVGVIADPAPAPAPAEPVVTNVAVTEPAPASAITGVLRRRASGPAVRELQELLIRHGHSVGVDGDFGAGTELAVRAFQRAHSIDADGVVGPETLRALRSAPGSSSPSTPAATTPEPVVTAPAATSRAQAWSNGRKIGMIDVVWIDGKRVSKRTADAYYRMREAARRDGVHLTVISGFRTYDEQKELYRLYRAGRGNLAAKPGHSNHQNGWALDLNHRGPGVYRWLTRNGARFGFRRTVPSEKWHWEYRG